MSEITDERLAELIANIQAFIDTDCVTVEDADVMSALRELQSARQRIAALTEALRLADSHLEPFFKEDSGIRKRIAKVLSGSATKESG